MSLLDAVRAGISVANQVTQPLQGSVSFSRWTGSDYKGNSTFLAPVTLAAIIDYKQAEVDTHMGSMALSKASVLFLDINALMAATGGRAVSVWDKIVLPDGTTGPILTIEGFQDAGTGRPAYTQVWIG